MSQAAVTCQGCKLALAKCTETAPHGTCGGYIHVIGEMHRCPYGGGIATPVLRLIPSSQRGEHR